MLKALIVFLALCVLTATYLMFRDDRWPPIPEKNKQALLDALAKWSSNQGRRTIPESDWPAELRELSPRYVTYENGQLDVLISSGGIGPGWGYYITESGHVDAKGMILVESKDARFQKFSQRE